MLTYRITALGRVQGVGFRPLICRLAGAHHITGTVRNEGGVVTIIAQGSREALLSSWRIYGRRGRLWRSRKCVWRKSPMRLCRISVRS